MSIITSPLLLGGTEGYQISRSLRFNYLDSANLSRTPSVASNRKLWTWAGWVKRGYIGSAELLFMAAYEDSNNFTYISFINDILLFKVFNSTFGNLYIQTDAVYRDPSAWYHVVVVYDADNATQSDRMCLYVNGSRVTAVTVNYPPTTGANSSFNTTNSHGLGGSTALSSYFDGYLADVHFIDGQALTPSSFTTTDLTTGQLIPKAYAGTYGTNGFKLNFSNNSTVAALGTDTSGNGNTFTVNNLSVTPGSGNDSLVDTPTSYGIDTGTGGEVRGNYATWNPLLVTPSGFSPADLRNGNLENVSSGSVCISTIGIPFSGKYYVEVSGTGCYAGVCTPALFPQIIYDLGSGITGIIGIAVNRDAGEVKLYKDNVLQSTTSFSSAGFSADDVPFIKSFSGYDGLPVVLNAGQRPFTYTAPSGFKALCDTNLPTPTITTPNTVMDTVLYTGNSTARSITGLAFNPDLVWIKSRSASTDHELTDSVRGATKSLSSNLTAAETTDINGLTAFNGDGFSLGTDTKYNNNTATYVGWAWDAGSTTVTNTAGSITSQVRANPSSGFSVVTYTGTGANATVGHGLNVAPGMVIVKRRNASTNWQVRHTSIPAVNSLVLNLRNQMFTDPAVWDSTAPTSTVFSVGTSADVNASSATYVAYCFSPVAGYSSFGSYTGTFSSEGPFVYLGFRPAVVLIKGSEYSAGEWFIFDDKREGYNVNNNPLYANLNAVEDPNDFIDITSNGFKVRTSNFGINLNRNHIYAAWATTPFQYARAR